jgi:hypothetical protein
MSRIECRDQRAASPSVRCCASILRIEETSKCYKNQRRRATLSSRSRARPVHSPMRQYQNRPYVTSPSIARAHTGASSYCKESAFEHYERSEALAQGSALAHHRGDDPRLDRYPPPLSSSMSRAGAQGRGDTLGHVHRQSGAGIRC